MQKLNLLLLDSLPIFEQLQLEEGLLRTNEENWCILNSGSSPAIILGISGAPLKFVDQTVFLQNPVPLIRRFSGGGTVFVDKNTFFSTFIFNHASYPEKMLQWTQQFYRPIFEPHPFSLKENDYAIGVKKCGGNAQYFCKNRSLHHTSFLFDYDSSNMNYLLFPEKTPKYREGRSHDEFLTRLNKYFYTISDLKAQIEANLRKHFLIQFKSLEEVLLLINKEHRKAVQYLT